LSKVLSQAGHSLADIYDVAGSIAGIDVLETRELPIVHEMGSTVFSERFSERIFRVESAALAQNTVIDLILTGLPTNIFRILSVIVIVDVTSRIANCAVSLANSGVATTRQEIPIWAWDAVNESTLRFIENNSTSNNICLNSDAQYDRLPVVGAGSNQARDIQDIRDIRCRGTTSAFGAGTVTVILNVLIAFSERGGLSSYGLPIPGW